MSLLALSLLLLIGAAKSQNINDIKLPLIGFLQKLSLNNPNIDNNFNWTADSDPCLDQWPGISCNKGLRSLQSIDLESLNLSGSIDGKLLSILCNSSSLSVLNLNSNSLTGNLPLEISYCSQLSKLFLNNNYLSGRLPSSLPNLRNLKKLDISKNNFSGDLPWNLSDISGLDTFLADHNHFTGTIPDFDLNYFDKFNVSFNQFSGSVPLNSAKFPFSSFNGNQGLCGKPLEVSCPPPPSSSVSKSTSVNKFVLVLGYVLLVLTLVLLLLYYLRKKVKVTPKREFSDSKPLNNGEMFHSAPRSEYSISSPQSAGATAATSLIVLSEDGKKDLRFEDLLRAPAELIRKGSFGSLYKVSMDGGRTELVVKRIKDSTVTGEEFQKKIRRLDQTRHPNVLPVTAFYCSKQEKLVVYEYQKNGSLFKLLHENRDHLALNWTTRMNVAASVSAGLSYMHQTLLTNNSAGAAAAAGHGNLKASNILFSSAMEPLISEYGLRALPTNYCQLDSTAADDEPFSTAADVYALGIIFLELLTGKPSQGFDLAQWVHSVVREEWTVEVFDRSLLAGDEDEMAEQAMVRLLQVALRCISPESRRPTIAEAAAMVEAVNEKKPSFQKR
ncbi:hypothetical protein M5K25_027624 [Dendrobium thyrsiflorum]|uniref:Protein kinase domain-containing protein n=1 Tax=Dendrobium thyrsiflorum TaxID=117978 RepID=A0ABD0TUH3_DENTH